MYITVPFNNMQTLKFKAQLTNVFFATVNEIFGGYSQLPTTAEQAVIKSLSAVQTTRKCSAVARSWEEPPDIWLTVVKNPFVSWALNFGVHMLLKGTVMHCEPNKQWWQRLQSQIQAHVGDVLFLLNQHIKKFRTIVLNEKKVCDLNIRLVHNSEFHGMQQT